MKPFGLEFGRIWKVLASPKHVQTVCPNKQIQWGLTRLALQAARRTWRPKSFQNRDRNPKNSMLKSNTILASIFQGFGPPFGMVFDRFFGSKMHAKSDPKKSARQAKSVEKTNTKSMSALLQQSMFRYKFDEKSHVF